MTKGTILVTDDEPAMRQALREACPAGIDVPSDVAAGRKLGDRVAALVLRKLGRYR